MISPNNGAKKKQGTAEGASEEQTDLFEMMTHEQPHL